MRRQGFFFAQESSRNHPGIVSALSPEIFLSPQPESQNRRRSEVIPSPRRAQPRNFRGRRFKLPPVAGSTKRCGRISAVLDRPILRNAVAYLVALTLARMPYDAESNAGLRKDNNYRARGSGRSADAVPRIPATAQRGHRRLETGDESTAIGALRSIVSRLLSRRGDTQVRR